MAAMASATTSSRASLSSMHDSTANTPEKRRILAILKDVREVEAEVKAEGLASEEKEEGELVPAEEEEDEPDALKAYRELFQASALLSHPRQYCTIYDTDDEADPWNIQFFSTHQAALHFARFLDKDRLDETLPPKEKYVLRVGGYARLWMGGHATSSGDPTQLKRDKSAR